MSELLTDPRVMRVANLLAQFGMRNGECARLLRALAEWYDPKGMRACETCSELFTARRRTARYCSQACKQVAYRRRNVT